MLFKCRRTRKGWGVRQHVARQVRLLHERMRDNVSFHVADVVFRLPPVLEDVKTGSTRQMVLDGCT